MGTLTLEVKEFIQDNIDLIEAEEWDALYNNAEFALDSTSTGGVTVALISAGFSPLDTLDYIPSYYLSDTHIKTFNIPSHIKYLFEGCFSYSTIEKIEIPQSVTQIHSFAFYDCRELKEIFIPESVTNIDGTAFSGVNGTIFCKKDSYADHYAQDMELKVKYIS